MRPHIAIISENTLCSMALRSLLLDIVSGIDVVCYHSLEECNAVADSMVAHYFVSASTVFHSPKFFNSIMRRTIILCDGDATPFVQSGFRTIDTTASEQHIVRTLLQIHQTGHPAGHHHGVTTYEQPSIKAEATILSARERDVLALMIKGHINKEIASELNISLTTVIYHRNNICEKLMTRSIGRLTIYAVLNNIVTLSEI